MRLTDNFTLDELTYSDTALRHGIDNVPTAAQVKKLQYIAEMILQPARNRLGFSIKVSSGFRCSALNKLISKTDKSQHCKAEAVDLKCEDNARLFHFIKERGCFDQLIWEYGDKEQPAWVHVSLKEKDNRQEVLRAVKDKEGKTIYQKF